MARTKGSAPSRGQGVRPRASPGPCMRGSHVAHGSTISRDANLSQIAESRDATSPRWAVGLLLAEALRAAEIVGGESYLTSRSSTFGRWRALRAQRDIDLEQQVGRLST